MSFSSPDHAQQAGFIAVLRQPLLSISSKSTQWCDVRGQMVVLGALYGSWGEQHFPSRKPVRTDALLFYVERLKELRQQIQAASEPTSDTATATAFVTFRQAGLCTG